MIDITGNFLVIGKTQKATPAPILFTDVPLSFWGGIDPVTGVVIDNTHPLFEQSVADYILCLPSGRGSCTASQVLLELILNGKAPKAIVLRDVDGLLCVGAIVAQEVFDHEVPDIICVGDQFASIPKGTTGYGLLRPDGGFTMSESKEELDAVSNEYFDCSSEMYLTLEESQLLDFCDNEADHMALRVLMRYAKLSSPQPEYLSVTKAHIDGTTYIGPGGLEFVSRLANAGGKVRVPTTLNAVSADRRRWKTFGVDPDYAHASIQVGNAYLKLGCEPDSFTCAPYLLPNPPSLGENLVWGESNAVVYSNSILGARTEKYADYLDICCAIVGKVPAAGVHLQENRQPRIVLDGTQLLKGLMFQLNETSEDDEAPDVDLELLFPALGHLCGRLSDGKVPILLGFNSYIWSSFITKDHLKSFCAAFGTTGTSPLIHIAGVTPEAMRSDIVQKLVDNCNGQVRAVSAEELQETFQILNTAKVPETDQQVDLIALGNPHLSLTECGRLAALVEKTGIPEKHSNVRFMACLSRSIFDKAAHLGHISTLQEFGVEFVNDTCWCMMLDPPVIPITPTATILTNSGKYAHYGPGLTNRNFRLGSMADCVNTAVTGKFRTQYSGGVVPPWLKRCTADGANISQQRTYASTVLIKQGIRVALYGTCRRGTGFR